ncbi:MAG: hypothetical protein AB1696_25225 [Planctomycetota bacterium]
MDIRRIVKAVLIFGPAAGVLGLVLFQWTGRLAVAILGIEIVLVLGVKWLDGEGKSGPVLSGWSHLMRCVVLACLTSAAMLFPIVRYLGWDAVSRWCGGVLSFLIYLWAAAGGTGPSEEGASHTTSRNHAWFAVVSLPFWVGGWYLVFFPLWTDSALGNCAAFAGYLIFASLASKLMKNWLTIRAIDDRTFLCPRCNYLMTCIYADDSIVGLECKKCFHSTRPVQLPAGTGVKQASFWNAQDNAILCILGVAIGAAIGGLVFTFTRSIALASLGGIIALKIAGRGTGGLLFGFSFHAEKVLLGCIIGGAVVGLLFFLTGSFILAAVAGGAAAFYMMALTCSREGIWVGESVAYAYHDAERPQEMFVRFAWPFWIAGWVLVFFVLWGDSAYANGIVFGSYLLILSFSAKFIRNWITRRFVHDKEYYCPECGSLRFKLVADSFVASNILETRWHCPRCAHRS